MRVIFFSKCWKFKLDFKNAAKNSKCFGSEINSIWIGIVKLSLLRKGYLSLAANMLKRSPKIWHVYKRHFLEHSFVASSQWIWSRCSDEDYNSVWARLPYFLSRHPLKRDFLDIYLTMFSESVISEIRKLSQSSFHSKCLKIKIDFKNGAK